MIRLESKLNCKMFKHVPGDGLFQNRNAHKRKSKVVTPLVLAEHLGISASQTYVLKLFTDMQWLIKNFFNIVAAF